MARGIKCAVKFGRFKWSRKGYAEVMDSGPVQSLVAAPARAIRSSCNAGFKPEHGEGPGYDMKRIQGKLAKGYVVTTATPHAYNSELRHNRLLGVLGSVSR